ncbi:MAG: hypothetical protein M1829_004780 [Trizodia sp. TS-e1964]|nr:MAG: hypothetical protein M1829_004780 [Trizodia sp. TS-e1964]
MEGVLLEKNGIRIAVEGCGHGALNAIYSAIEESCKAKGWEKVDLLIIGGDFQSVRNERDLHAISMPKKYWKIGDFQEYYSGARVAPYTTIFVGGNHEASNYLRELYYGGWVAPNIFYLGAANVVRFGGLRIAGISGIWKSYDYRKSHYERLPYSENDLKSVYHVRELDVRKLLQIRTQIDIGISHDWPQAVEWNGNHQSLFRFKPYFKDESEAGTLGNPPVKYLMDRLRPQFWFSAHLHVKFSALVQYEKEEHPPVVVNPGNTISTLQLGEATKGHRIDELKLQTQDDGRDPTSVDDSSQSLAENFPEQPKAPGQNGNHENGLAEESTPEALNGSDSQPPPASTRTTVLIPRPLITNLETRFLALDKCEPGKKFLQLLEIVPFSDEDAYTSPRKEKFPLEYDKEWLAITRVFAPYLQLDNRNAPFHAHEGESHYLARIEEEEQWVEANVVKPGKLVIPENFTLTAPPFDPVRGIEKPEQPVEYNNPQTIQFCNLVGIENRFFATDEELAARSTMEPAPPSENQRTGGRGGFGGGRGRGGGGGGRNRGGGNRGRGGQGKQL